MKLLTLKIGDSFRSLPANFKVRFQDEDCVDEQETFRPICFVGLNGCGKSNVLEVLSHIFYHLELCVSVHLPRSVNGTEIFKRNECVIDDYVLEYYHYDDEDNPSINFNKSAIAKVRITKKINKDPKMLVSYPFSNNKETIPITLKSIAKGLPAEGKRYLPKYIIAYSSGENETLSIPYLKSRLLHLEEFKRATYEDYNDYDSPENGMIYIDSNMSQAILLSCLLFEQEDTLECLRNYNYTGISAIKKFRMSLRNQNFDFLDGIYKKKCEYFSLLRNGILKKLLSCSTLSWENKQTNTLYLDFYVGESTKRAFQKFFKTGMECFQAFRLLYELNYYSLSPEKEDEVLESKGIYTEGKISLPDPEHDIFHFLDFYITKKISKEGNTDDILLRSFSDGEHQFLHTMAICLLLKDSDSLILLDEPETHFNPNWRSHFISILNESLKRGSSHSRHSAKYNNFLKQVLITSHSPFIISDCLPRHVLILQKDNTGNTIANNAADLNIRTYGTTVNLLTAEIFNQKDSIGAMAYEEMQQIGESMEDKKQAIDKINAQFGQSLEKLMYVTQLKEG